jgi:hypothetical protein
LFLPPFEEDVFVDANGFGDNKRRKASRCMIVVFPIFASIPSSNAGLLFFVINVFSVGDLGEVPACKQALSDSRDVNFLNRNGTLSR